MNRQERRRLEREGIRVDAVPSDAGQLRIRSPEPPGLLAVPVGESMPSRAAAAIASLFRALPPESELAFLVRDATIAGKRNAAARQLLKNPRLGWLLFVDADMVVPRGAFPLLAFHAADIVGALYAGRVPPFHLEAGCVSKQAAAPDPLTPTDNPQCEITELPPRRIGEVVAVDVVGAGLMLVRRRVFEGMEYPWFVANMQDTEELDWGQAGYGQNEDFNFCLRAKALGFRILCDTRVQPEHLGSMGVTIELAQQWKRLHLKSWMAANGIAAEP